MSKPLGWIIEENAAKYFETQNRVDRNQVDRNRISRNTISSLLPMYLASINGEMNQVHLNTCCLIVNLFVAKDVHRNMGSLPLSVLIGCLRRLGSLGELYVQLSESNEGVVVSEKLKASISSSTPRLVSLVARNAFLSIMSRDGFDLDDLDDLEEVFEMCKNEQYFAKDDLRRLGRYLQNLKEYSNCSETLKLTASSHSLSINDKLQGESSLNQKLLEYCDFLRQRVQKLSFANPKQILKNGRSVDAFCRPLMIARVMSEPKVEEQEWMAM